MRVGVGDAVKDGVVLEEQFEAADVGVEGESEEQKTQREGNATPGQRHRAAEAAGKGSSAASHQQEQRGHDGDQDGHGQQPARDFPHRQREEIEAEWLAQIGSATPAARGA